MSNPNVRPIRIPPAGNFVELVKNVNEALVSVSDQLDRTVDELLFADAELLRVPVAQTGTFAFPTSRRIFGTEGPFTNDIPVLNTGQTIVPHGLGRKPVGRIEVGRSASSVLIDIDVAGPLVVPPLDPAKFIAFRASTTAIFRIIVL